MADEEKDKPAEAPAPTPKTLPNTSNLTPFPGQDHVGNLFTDYNPQGALGGLFSPAYIRGFQPSEDAVQQYRDTHDFSRDQVEQTRMPNPWEPPAPPSGAYGMGAGGKGAGQYIGANLPTNQTYGLDPRGMVDPAALRASAQGTPYDMNARRDAIAQQVAANQTAAANFDKWKTDAYNSQMAFWGAPGGASDIYNSSIYNHNQPQGAPNVALQAQQAGQPAPGNWDRPQGLTAPGFGMGLYA